MAKKPAAPPTPLDRDAFVAGLERLAKSLEDVDDDDDESVITSDDVSHFAEHYDSWSKGNVGHTWEDLYAYEGIFDMDPDGFESTLVPALVAKNVVPAAKKPVHINASLDLRSDHERHHVLFGDTTVEGDLVFDGFLVVVGNLTVTGVISTGDEADVLIVAGDVKARGIDAYNWQCGVCASGKIVVEEALGIGQTLIAERAKAGVFFEGEGFWNADVVVSAKARFAYDDLDDDVVEARAGKGELAQLFKPELFAKNEKLADQHAFLGAMFDSIRAKKSIWK